MKVIIARPVIVRENLFLSPRGDAGLWFAEPGVCDSIEVVSETPVDVYQMAPRTCVKVVKYRTSPNNADPFRLYYEQPITINSGGGMGYLSE